MAADENGLPVVYVQPGELRLVEGPAILRTLLGSCVGVTFWSRRLLVGALCHPMLPRLPERERSGVREESTRRYVDCAIRELARRFRGLGVAPGETEVKLFGGADVLAVETAGPTARATVGQQNRDTALRIVRELGYCVVAQRLGGTRGVHLDFHTATGDVRLRKL